MSPPEALTRAMILLIGRLEYLTAPTAPEFDPDSIILRPLRTDNEREFRDYFRLRHSVYSQMGYLDEATEASPSKLEMDETDTHSIHLGAFCQSRCSKLLIGSARVVTNGEADPTLVACLKGLPKTIPCRGAA